MQWLLIIGLTIFVTLGVASRWFVVVWFAVFSIFSVASFGSPGLLMVVFFFTLGVGGYLMLAANTVLLYSVALLPVVFALRNKTGGTTGRLRCTLPALIVPALVAVGPGSVSGYQAWSFAQEMSGGDFHRPSIGRPKHIAIAEDGPWPYNYYSPADARLECNEVCRSLLFNYEVASVRMVKLPDPRRGRANASTVSYGATHTMERRDFCPQAFGSATPIEAAVRQRIAAGECLIKMLENEPQVDATIATKTLAQAPVAANGVAVPKLVVLDLMQQITIEQRGDDGSITPILQRTELKTKTLALPFYFAYGTITINDGPELGRDQRNFNVIRIAETLRTVFGFAVKPIEPVPPEQNAELLERILATPANEPLTGEQQSVLTAAILRIAAAKSPSTADIAFLERVLRDPRTTDPQLVWNMQFPFRKFPHELEPLIPFLIDRSLIASLNWYSGEALTPYREQIFRLVEQQPESRLIERIAEVGGNPSKLLATRLNDPSAEIEQRAATATCRASPQVWPLIEPVVLERLDKTETQKGPASQPNLKLVLALIRHGQTAAVDRYLATLDPPNKGDIQSQTRLFKPGFRADDCYR